MYAPALLPERIAHSLLALSILSDRISCASVRAADLGDADRVSTPTLTPARLGPYLTTLPICYPFAAARLLRHSPASTTMWTSSHVRHHASGWRLQRGRACSHQRRQRWCPRSAWSRAVHRRCVHSRRSSTHVSHDYGLQRVSERIYPVCIGGYLVCIVRQCEIVMSRIYRVDKLRGFCPVYCRDHGRIWIPRSCALRCCREIEG